MVALVISPPNQPHSLSLHAAAMTPPVTAPTHPHPTPSESTITTKPEQQLPPPPPPPPTSGVEFEVPPKKRKVEEVGFSRSPYYTIRETVANLRGRFLQVPAQNPNILEFHSAIAAAIVATPLASWHDHHHHHHHHIPNSAFRNVFACDVSG